MHEPGISEERRWIVDTKCGPITLKLSSATSGDRHCALTTLDIDEALAVFHQRNMAFMKNVQFAKQLEQLHSALGSVKLSGLRVWPLHSMNAKAAGNDWSCEDEKKLDSNDGQYLRGFLIGLSESALENVTTLKDIITSHEFKIALRLQKAKECDAWSSVDHDICVTDEANIDEAIHPAFWHRGNNVLFHSLSEVRRVLSQLPEDPDCKELLRYLPPPDDPVKNVSLEQDKQFPFPCIVVEGLDAAGKSTIVEHLVSSLCAVRRYSPPQTIHHLRKKFDAMPPVIRRAYYTVGNYIVSQDMKELLKQHPVILDRFWHSTTAYAIAEECLLPPQGHWAYKWPVDLIKPTTVFLLVVSEEVRRERMARRQLEQTTEETQLADEARRRERTLAAYRRMYEPSLVEVNADESIEKVLQQIIDILKEKSVWERCAKD